MPRVEKLKLSEHTLDINLRRGSKAKFDFAEVEDYVRALCGDGTPEYREYQFSAIKQLMQYLWAGGYESINELAEENFERKEHIRSRFGSKEIMYGNLPLPGRLSGTVHMATGTGKSFAMFAVAYLSIVLGLTKRVLVLGPSSTIIEEGLREKFQALMSDPKLNALLPKEYQGVPVNILNDNDTIEDNSIVVENVNAIYTFGGIWDTLFNDVDDVLVLSDEVHHAYSHLNFNDQNNQLEMDAEVEGRISEADEERLWMQFLLGKGRYRDPKFFDANGKHKIKRHVGFTGTPYNDNNFFADVIYDYNVRQAIEEQFIKDIDPIIKTEAEDGELQWSEENQFQVVLQNHERNHEKYSYEKNGQRRVKPITVFYCPSQTAARNDAERFIQFLAQQEKQQSAELSAAEAEAVARDRVICAVSNAPESEYKEKLDRIEETNPEKVGGKVEFVFSVSKLLEGWDVDNVFQIVPMKQTAFNSKLKISQVFGRGLRLPRNVGKVEILANYPLLTVTNHERFGSQIIELVEAVVESDLLFTSVPLEEGERSSHHFKIANLSYLAATRVEEVEPETKEIEFSELKLHREDTDQDVKIYFDQGTRKYKLPRKRVTVDQVVDGLVRRFRAREYEGIRFDFGAGEQFRAPTEDEIRKKILEAMEAAEISSNGLTEKNKQQIELYFNQFLPPSKKRRVFENVLGDIVPISTKSMERRSMRVGELERYGTVFVSESFEDELDNRSLEVIKYLAKERKPSEQSQLAFTDPDGLLGIHKDYVRPLEENDPRPPYFVKDEVFQTPQSTLLVSHSPEKQFTFKLFEHASLIESFVKSPDRDFYSLDYDYWKKGKNQTYRSFNPDFIIKINLTDYLHKATFEGAEVEREQLRNLEEQGISEIIRIVEIKSDEDDDETTDPKAEAGKTHAEALNKKLREVNPGDLAEEDRVLAKQIYTFDLLKPEDFARWFGNLEKGKLQLQ